MRWSLSVGPHFGALVTVEAGCRKYLSIFNAGPATIIPFDLFSKYQTSFAQDAIAL